MPFKKGASGNPGGRPRVLGDVQELARDNSTEAINTLKAVMADKAAPPAARVAAANSILDRGYGKPAQTVNANLKTQPHRDMTDAELLVVAAGAPGRA
jgi:hypothetical protein